MRGSWVARVVWTALGAAGERDPEASIDREATMIVARHRIAAALLLLASILLGASAQESRKRDEAAGTSLLFGVDFDAAVETGDLGPKADQAAVLAKVIQVMRQRLEAGGARGARIEAQGADRILVELPTTEAAAVDALVHRLTYIGRLEMRMLATREYNRGEVRFDLGTEQDRLMKWLGREENKKRIMADPSAIAAFNRNAGNGKEDGPLSPHLHWLPGQAVRQRRKDAQGLEKEAWVYRPLGGRDGNSLTMGFAPEGTEAADTNPRFFAINRHEVFFKNEDLVRGSIRTSGSAPPRERFWSFGRGPSSRCHPAPGAWFHPSTPSVP